MGCGSSKAANRVVDPSKAPLPASNKDDGKLGLQVKGRPESGIVSVSGINTRGVSATSGRSVDSGLGSASQSPDRPDSSTLLGKEQAAKALLDKPMVPQRRVDSSKILESLRQEGFLSAPHTATAHGGVKFEIPLDDLKVPAKPPVRLQKLERVQQMSLTRDKLKEKLEQAEKRRKKKHVELLQKSKETEAKNLEVKIALLDFDKKKEKQLVRKLSQKADTVSERRETVLKTVVEKQRKVDDKAKEVRHRKATTPRSMNVDPQELEQMTPRPTPHNLDELPVAAALKP